MKVVKKYTIGDDFILDIKEEEGKYFINLRDISGGGGGAGGGEGEDEGEGKKGKKEGPEGDMPVPGGGGGEGEDEGEDEGEGAGGEGEGEGEEKEKLDDFLGDDPEDFKDPPIVEQGGKELKRDPTKGKGSGFGVGGGEGLDIAPPDITPYARELFKTLREKNRPLVKQMLHVLRLDLKPKYWKDNWRRVGRMMSQVLPTAVLQSRVRPVDNIYVRNRVEWQQKEVMLLILVDVSGSFDLRFQKDVEKPWRNSLQMIAEVAATWLPDENFAIYWFASNMERVKSFSESFKTCKFRIGAGSPNDPGYTGQPVVGGGTEVLIPARKIREMWKHAKDRPCRKLFILISDFYFENQPSVVVKKRLQKELLRWKRDYGVISVLIANFPLSTKSSHPAQKRAVEDARLVAGTSKSNQLTLRSPCAYVVNMPNYNDLPMNFIKVYEKIANDEKLPGGMVVRPPRQIGGSP